MKKNRKAKIGNSFIAGQTGKVSEKLRAMLDSSATSRLVDRIGGFDENYKGSLASTVSTDLKLQERVFTPFKRYFARSAETSIICSFYRNFISSLLSSPTYVLGIFFLVFGLFCSIILAIKAFFISSSVALTGDFLTPLIVVALSFVHIFCRESISRKLADSRFFSFLFFDLLLLNRMSDYEKNDEKAAVGKRDGETKKRLSIITPFFLGILAGIASLFTSPGTVLTALAVIIGVAVVIHSPESGLCLVLLLFPIAGESKLSFLSAIMLISYVLKLMRGKRNISFDHTDTILLLISLFLCISLKSGYVFCAMAVYIVAVNTAKTKKILSGYIGAVSFGFLICIVYGAAEFAIGCITDYIKTDKLTFQPVSSVFSTGSDFIIQTICILPFFLFKKNSTRAGRFRGFVALVFLAFVCILSGVSASVPMLLLSLMLYFIISTDRLMEGVLGMAALGFVTLRFFSFDNSFGAIIGKNVNAISNSVGTFTGIMFGRGNTIGTENAGGIAAIVIYGGLVFVFLAFGALSLVICKALTKRKNTNDKSVYAVCLVPIITFIIFSVQFNVLYSGITVVMALAASMARTGGVFAKPKSEEWLIN